MASATRIGTCIRGQVEIGRAAQHERIRIMQSVASRQPIEQSLVHSPSHVDAYRHDEPQIQPRFIGKPTSKASPANELETKSRTPRHSSGAPLWVPTFANSMT